MNQDDDLLIHIDELIKHLKDGKAPGNDNIHSELLNMEEIHLSIYLLNYVKYHFLQKWPPQWTQYIVISISNKGNLRKCENYNSSNILLRIIMIDCIHKLKVYFLMRSKISQSGQEYCNIKSNFDTK